MPGKRYQVFISSTFEDMQVERREVTQAILRLDMFPAGMEIFPAANDDQWSLIKKVIDDSDYYVLLIGGKYGSMRSDGISYTEMEYRYAIEQGKPVLGFIHNNPDSLPFERCEADADTRNKLEAFRQRVKAKMCQMWESPSELAAKVTSSLAKITESTPAIGWVRGESKETEELKDKIHQLEHQLFTSREKVTGVSTADLAQGEDTVDFSYTSSLTVTQGGHVLLQKETFDVIGLQWSTIFYLLGPQLAKETPTYVLLNTLNEYTQNFLNSHMKNIGHTYKNLQIRDFDFNQVIIQFRALGYITHGTSPREEFDQHQYWILTKHGDECLVKDFALRRNTE